MVTAMPANEPIAQVKRIVDQNGNAASVTVPADLYEDFRKYLRGIGMIGSVGGIFGKIYVHQWKTMICKEGV